MHIIHRNISLLQHYPSLKCLVLIQIRLVEYIVPSAIKDLILIGPCNNLNNNISVAHEDYIVLNNRLNLRLLPGLLE